MYNLHDLPSCPWCDGKDKNFRPLRWGIVPCNNPWHNEDARKANEPCKKHNHSLPCPYCKIEELEDTLKEVKTKVKELGDMI